MHFLLPLAGTRETAFVHAISAAGLAHALTRACSSGRMDDCGCDRSVRGVSKEGFKVRPPPGSPAACWGHCRRYLGVLFGLLAYRYGSAGPSSKFRSITLVLDSTDGCGILRNFDDIKRFSSVDSPQYFHQIRKIVQS